MKRKLTVTVTKSRRQVMTIPSTTLRTRCPVCQCEVETLSTAEAAAMLEIAGRMLDAMIANGQVHGVQTVSRSLRVCKDSLFGSAD